MIDEHGQMGWLGQIATAVASAIISAWKLVSWRVSKLEQQIAAQVEAASESRDRDRAANHSDIQRLDGKIDRHHDIVMGHLMDIKGRLK